MLQNENSATLTASPDVLTEQARALLLANRLITREHQYTVPAPTTYPYQWLWDSCFHAVCLAKFDLLGAKAEMRSLVSAQFANGMIPHMIYWNPGSVHLFRWGRNGTSSITQPPMLAYAVWEIYRVDEDKAFLEEIYPALYRFHSYLTSVRDPRNNHLIGIINPDESGEDNSPRFDDLLGLGPVHDLEENLRRRMLLVEEIRHMGSDEGAHMKRFFWVKDVTFNAIAVENMRKLARIAETLNKTEDGEYWRLQADLVEKGMREKMFADGVFWSTHGEDYKKIKIKTWAIFAPLFAGTYSPEEAKAVVQDYFWNETEFKTPYVVPTVALSEPSYDSRGFWRGPVWIGANWFIYKGLKRYGFNAEAEAVAASCRALLTKSGFREYFDPITGEGLGAENFTWGALVTDMD